MTYPRTEFNQQAFLNCGFDFVGHFIVKTSFRRNAPLIKGYVYVFVCFATKAVDLGIFGDSSTAALIDALNRFFNRRGRSSIVYMDNAANFVGANRKLKEWRN